MSTEERGVTKAFAKVCPCEACKKGRFEPSKIRPETIHSYSSQPDRGWTKTATEAENAAMRNGAPAPMYMGVELETSIKGDERDLEDEADRRFPHPPEPRAYDYYSPEYRAWSETSDRIYEERRQWMRDERSKPTPWATAEEAVSMAEPEGWWHPKHDSSVSGPEFASLPGTLAYWYGLRDDLTLMFTSLLHSGVRSHTGDKAGMHISMSVESFGNSEHLKRFARLVNLNPTWSRKMSQRTDQSLHWSQIGYGQFGSGNDDRLDRWARAVMEYGADERERYVAINACGGGRIEFRLPRGTLRVDRFYKNLEWVHSMVEFTREFAATDAATYMRWVMGQQNYPDLRAWFTEKFGILPGVPFTPDTAEVVPSAMPNMADSRDDDSMSRYCDCGDGCQRGDCGNCDDDDQEPDDTCTNCGARHQLATRSYQRFINNGYMMEHWTTSGALVGPERVYDTYGNEYQYDNYGSIIAGSNRPTLDTPTPTSTSQVVAYGAAERERLRATLESMFVTTPPMEFAAIPEPDLDFTEGEWADDITWSPLTNIITNS